MSTHKLSSAFVLATICQLLAVGHSAPVCAEEPIGVRRTFAVISLSPIDFQSEDSIGVVTAPPPSTSADFMTFYHTNSDSRFNSTVWQFQQAMHITHGESNGAFVWLLTDETPTPPPTGAVTLSGHGCFRVLDQEVFRIKDCDTTECGYDFQSGDVHLTSDANSSFFTVVTAVFSN